MLRRGVPLASVVMCLVPLQIGFAYRGAPTDCDLGSLSNPGSCSLRDEYCEVTEGPIAWDVQGTEVWLQDCDLCENCDEACGDGDPYSDPPNPITCNTTLSVSFTNSVSHEVTGGIEGGSFIGGVKASLEVAAGGQDGTQINYSKCLSATVPGCDWQVLYVQIKTIQGSELHKDVQVQPVKIWNCNGTNVYQSGMTVNGTVSTSADVGVEGSGVQGTLDHGSCPPDPPDPEAVCQSPT